jgi:hypothetical protein
MKVGMFMQYFPMGTFLYTVQYQDTLWLLAKRFNTTIDAIIMANPGINPDGLFVGQRICIPVGSGFYHPRAQRINNDIFDLSNHLRLLWSQSLWWLRSFMVSSLYNLPDLEEVTKRLLSHPEAMAQVFIPFYEQKQVCEWQNLLTHHVKISIDVVTLTKQQLSISEKVGEWEANATEIAQFLSSLNPHWSSCDWQRMLHKYLQLLKAQLTYYINHDYIHGVTLFDDLLQHALNIADMMTNGIIKQFPKQFYRMRNKKG